MIHEVQKVVDCYPRIQTFLFLAPSLEKDADTHNAHREDTHRLSCFNSQKVGNDVISIFGEWLQWNTLQQQRDQGLSRRGSIISTHLSKR